jgi:hypothetical protein
LKKGEGAWQLPNSNLKACIQAYSDDDTVESTICLAAAD